LSNIILTVNASNIAAQIAMLLNLGGQLAYSQTEQSVRYGHITYIIEMYGDQVAGVIGLEKKGKITELKHLCVHPSFRNKGIGIKLLKKGIENAKTNIVYGAVRSDNITNIKNNLRIGMRPICKHRGRRNATIIIFARRI